MDESKRCARCREYKPVTEFGPGKKWRDGLYPYCRGCAREVNRRTYEKNRGKYNARARVRYQISPTEKKESAARWQRLNREKRNAYLREWDKRNADKRRESKRRWQQANNATFIRASNARRRAVKANAPTVPFHAEQLLARVAYFGGKCWICGAGYEALDHVKPLSRGGWHCLSNLRPICRACNTRKRDRWPFVRAA